MKKTLFEAWEEGTVTNLGNFMTKLFQLYQIADGKHRSRLKTSFPEYFTNLTLVVLLFLLLSFTASAQTYMSEQLWLAKDKTYHESIYLKADTMTVKEGFDYLKRLKSGRLWYLNRYVIKNDTTYLRYSTSPTPWRTFIVKKNGRRKHIKL